MYVENAVQSFSDRGSIPLRSTSNVTLHPMSRQCSAEEQTLFPREGCVFVPDKSAITWIYAHFFKVCVFV